MIDGPVPPSGGSKVGIDHRIDHGPGRAGPDASGPQLIDGRSLGSGAKESSIDLDNHRACNFN
jgi:hypothetical protein